MNPKSNIQVKNLSLKNIKIRLIFDNEKNLLIVNDDIDNNKPYNLISFEVFGPPQWSPAIPLDLYFKAAQPLRNNGCLFFLYLKPQLNNRLIRQKL